MRILLATESLAFLITLLFLTAGDGGGGEATLEELLLREEPAALARAARAEGNAARGALLFHRPELACAACHGSGGEEGPLGPDLAAAPGPEKADASHVVESLLRPSAAIRRGYEAVTLVTRGGAVLSGIIGGEQDGEVVLRSAAGGVKRHTIPPGEILERLPSDQSLMPAGLVNQLSSRSEFLDLLSYLIEIAESGPARALELRPAAALLAAPELPEYEKDIDHAGLIAALDASSYRRGEAIYNRLCINCHGTKEFPGTLPGSPRFATAVLKNGSDPHSMYQTLTRGFGLMPPQSWMVPRQKYDVIHYIREAYFKEANPSQYFSAGREYLSRLPAGSSRGPEPPSIEAWVNMDYGPSLMATYEVGSDGSNLAQKGIAIRLDPGPGGISRGRAWALYDHDTLRLAAFFEGEGFIDWNGILFNGRHEVHPRIRGRVHAAIPSGPGWAGPAGGFDDPRPRDREGRRYGPLPRSWGRYRGLYHHGHRAILSYTVGETEVLEMPGLERAPSGERFTRALALGPRAAPLLLEVAHRRGGMVEIAPQETGGSPLALLGSRGQPSSAAAQAFRFDGSTGIEIARPESFEMAAGDYTIEARIRTRRGGTIFAQTSAHERWVEDGKSLFVRGGRLVFDIGWVGAVQSRRRVDDGEWHEVAMTYEHESGAVKLYVDGRLEGEGRLAPRRPLDAFAIRLGRTATDFPEPSCFDGEIAAVRFLRRALRADELALLLSSRATEDALLARWEPAAARGELVPDLSGNGHDGKVERQGGADPESGVLAVRVAGWTAGMEWIDAGESLRLKIPAGKEPLRLMLRLVRADSATRAAEVLAASVEEAPELAILTRGGPPRWTALLETEVRPGGEEGPFAACVLLHPEANPWFSRLRFSGLDFLDGGRAALSTWDGDVWLVSGLDEPSGRLVWRRIASGLFQPLGLKVARGAIHVACRDQIAILRDLDGDGEIDFYECFNNDHQVTEHFHEFAMGLQTDAAGNFYYAKSARHARTALVPHHGTLLRVTADGSRTEVVATGFRAANGVCVNPDGTFYVTDQEGHWTPKNRINLVREGGFYGNLWGYHEVTDASDDAMKEPVCWITNAFDRSPSELVRVASESWGKLDGAVLSLSYGYGQVFLLLEEEVNGRLQGGLCALPVPRFPTGLLRGRIRPEDGSLYLCGLFAWAGTQQAPGGFYHLRPTGKELQMPLGLRAWRGAIEIRFGCRLDPETAARPASYAVKRWSIERSAAYGSEHKGETRLEIAAARLSGEGDTVVLSIPELRPAKCMEVLFKLRSAGGASFEGAIHNTIHELGE
jgi:putative heme-binding domain-containing protein